MVARRRGRAWFASTLVVGASLLAPGLGAQPANNSADPAIAVTIRGGHAWYGTGDSDNCGTGTAFSAGISASSRGPVHFAAAVDTYLDWGAVCTLLLRETTFRGDLVSVWGTSTFSVAPRLSAEGGYQFSRVVGSPISLLTAFGAGLQFTEVRFGETAGGDTSGWRPWYGASVRVEYGRLPLGLRVEIGQRQLLRRYCPALLGDCVQNGGIVREFEIWRTVGTIGFTYRL
jgi:hypothetical protein